MTEAIEQIHATAMLLVPEIILLATVCVLFLAGPMLVSDAGEARRLAASVGISVACRNCRRLGHLVWRRPRCGPRRAFPHRQSGVVHARPVACRLLLALVLWNQIDDGHAAEAHACLLSILVGTNLVAAADDLVSLFLALELVSIPTYVILYLPRRDRPAAKRP